MNRAIFLDRDGVITKQKYDHERGIYSAKNTSEIELIDGVKASLQKLKDLGFLLIIVSNQPGVAYGHIQPNDLLAIDEALKKTLPLDAIYNCTHHPHHDTDCECRKPKDGLLRKAAQDHHIDLSRSYMIGDNLSDITAGKSCHATILIQPRRADILSIIRETHTYPTYHATNLTEACNIIRQEETDHRQSTRTPILIVAAGIGSRLKELTKATPKCLVPLNGRPLIDYQIQEFKRQGFTNLIFCLSYENTQVTQHFHNGKTHGVDIRYSIEPYFGGDKLSGTAGAVRHAQELIDAHTFIVYYGDALSTIDLNALLIEHERTNALATIAVRIARPEHFSSIITLDEDKRVTTFIEKPTAELKEKYKHTQRYENNGIYVFNRRVLNHLSSEHAIDFAKDLFPLLLTSGERVQAYVHDGFFIELGKPERYHAFQKEFNTSTIHEFATKRT